MKASATVRLRNPSSLYFGKIASRGDFVKSASRANVISLIDNWVAQGMEMLIATPAWKAYYDNAGAVDFLFIAPRKKHAICGCLIPSSDASLRRFPFIAATLFETEDALAFLPISPLALERHIGRQRALVHHASKTHDAVDTLNQLGDMPFDQTPVAGDIVDAYDDFLVNTSLASLENTLKLEEGHAAVRRLVLALGVLLQPILTNYAAPPPKGLALPLPRDPGRMSLVKALWLDLVTVFLTRAEFDVSIISCIHYGTSPLTGPSHAPTPPSFVFLLR